MEKNKMISSIQNWARAWNETDLTAADYFFADDFEYTGATKKWNLMELKEFYLNLKKQNQGVKVKVDNLVCEGNKFGINWTLSCDGEVVSVGAGTGEFKDNRLTSFSGVTTD